MNFNNRSNLFKHLKDKNVFIWGARMTGIGALRQLKKEDINVVSFIDSDPAFENNSVHGLFVKNPKDLKKISNTYKNAVILIAVSLKEDEILQQLQDLDIHNLEIISFLDENSPYYTIDILGSCNLKCASCPHSITDSSVPKGSMKFETFVKVFDKIILETPSISHISLYSWGEPLLHPYIDKIIDYVHERNVSVALSSNLSIKFENRIEKIIKSNPDYLKISLSGFFPKAYNQTHEGGDINLVKSNLRLLRKLIDKYKSNTLVDINYHLYRDNCGENLYKMKNFAKELNFIVSETFALIMPLERVFSHLKGSPDYQTKKLQDNLLVTIDEGINASSKYSLPKNSCPFRENQININSDLSIPVCCTVWERENNVVAKNYLETNLKEINYNKGKAEICKKCMNLRLPEYNMGFNKQGWKQYAKEKTITDVGDK